MKPKVKIYLDDERFPKNPNYKILRSYQQFIDFIVEYGLPDEISFDHDIASFDNDGNEKTGYDAAKWLVNYCIDNDLKLPKWNVHSANSIGAENIEVYLSNFEKHQNS